ncbi:hypothetical protein [Rhodococcus indonesiensis]
MTMRVESAIRRLHGWKLVQKVPRIGDCGRPIDRPPRDVTSETPHKELDALTTGAVPAVPALVVAVTTTDLDAMSRPELLAGPAGRATRRGWTTRRPAKFGKAATR